MSSKKQIFYILAHKSFGVKMLKSPSSVKKYENLYPADLVVEQFSEEKDAKIRLENLNGQYLNYRLAHDTILKEISNEGKKFSLKTPTKETTSENFYTNPSKKEEYKYIEENIYKHFYENANAIQKAKEKIDSKETYHLFFDTFTQMQSKKVFKILKYLS